MLFGNPPQLLNVEHNKSECIACVKYYEITFNLNRTKMNLVKQFADDFINCLNINTCLNIKIGAQIIVTGENANDLRENLIVLQGQIHQAGVYIIGTADEVIYIGEGGPDLSSTEKGTMGHRVFCHTKKKWFNDVRTIIFVPIKPREYSRLGEQLAFALYFKSKNILPLYNLDWR